MSCNSLPLNETHARHVLKMKFTIVDSAAASNVPVWQNKEHDSG